MARNIRPNQKATFLIAQETLVEARKLVEQGAARSLNAFVSQAVEEQIRRIKQDQIDRAIQEAGRDPLFLKDVKDTMQAFAAADAAAAERLEKRNSRR